MYTHYSLFRHGVDVIDDFAALPTGGLPELLAGIRAKLDCPPTHCVSITSGTLHPDGKQMSFGVGLRGEEVYSLILMTLDCVKEHAAELASEGNHDSAELAAAALA